MEKIKIILASSSPRRIEMMKKNGINPIIIPPRIEEDLPSNMDPKEAVMQLALKKARYVEAAIRSEYTEEPAFIIGADTVVFLDRIIGKPKDRWEAYNILNHLRGKEHFVATGFAILKAGSGEERVFCEVTDVRFKNYTDEEIHAYIDTDEPYDKAGGYAIQGAWGDKIEYIRGDYDNVVGFPWTRIKRELDAFIKASV
ncbi:MAG: Maf family protein [Bacillota bacterium]|jgi:septum formation protein|nr:Maf family protein [Bacillota bacterium]